MATAPQSTAAVRGAWPPPYPVSSKPANLPPSQFDKLSQLLPVDLIDREILFIESAALSERDKLPRPKHADQHVWNGRAIRRVLKRLASTRAYEACVLVVLTRRTGLEISQTSSPFLGWGIATHTSSGSSNVRSLTLLDVLDGHETTATPLLRSHREPGCTTFDGLMDVVLPSAEFVNGMSIEAFMALFGAPRRRMHYLPTRADGALV